MDTENKISLDLSQEELRFILSGLNLFVNGLRFHGDFNESNLVIFKEVFEKSTSLYLRLLKFNQSSD